MSKGQINVCFVHQNPLYILWRVQQYQLRNWPVESKRERNHGTYNRRYAEKYAHAKSELLSLICLRHLFRSTTFANLKKIVKRSVFLHTYATCPVLPSYISTLKSIKRNL